MPEGDTVWLTAKRLNAALQGQELTRFELRVPQLATLDLRGQVVDQVLARGKHLLIRLGADQTLHSHLRMDGSWRIIRKNGRYPTPEHQIRVILGNDTWVAVGLRIHDLALVPRGEEASVVGHLGPDLLGPDWSAESAVSRLLRDPARDIGSAIMDQRNLAGIGNVYKSETLFLTGVHPWTPVAAAHADGKLDRIVQRAHILLAANREHPEQSTTGSLARGQQHWVYLRAGQPCRRCGTLIQRGHQGDEGQERSTYWCPHCQPSRADEATPPVNE